MATTFNAEVKTKKRNGTYKVYIRCTHNRENKYIPTDMFVHEGKVSRNKEIKDPYVNGVCATMILDYHKKLNLEKDISSWSVDEIIEFVTRKDENISFDDWCKIYIDKYKNEERNNTATGYISAVSSFRKFFKMPMNFQDITKKGLTEWIKSLEKTKRAKENYPRAIKTIFNAGLIEYNNSDKGIIRIQNRPFDGVKIPRHDLPIQKAVDADVLRKIIQFKPTSKQTEMAVDVAKLMICLAGINTIDIFKRVKDDLKNGKLCYNRSKTASRRTDKAYFEIKILPEIEDLMKKWNKGERLFDFGYRTAKNFNKYVNIGLSKICKEQGIEKVDTYTFRHSWATIAHYHCGASLDLVGKSLNHIASLKVTAGYIKRDFTSVDEMNKAVVNFIFYGMKPELTLDEKESQKITNEMFELLMILSRLNFEEKENIAVELLNTDREGLEEDKVYEMSHYPFMKLDRKRFTALLYVSCSLLNYGNDILIKYGWDKEYRRAMELYSEKMKGQVLQTVVIE